VIATAPGKLIVTGEYAVLDGALAVVIAVDRRAIARRVPGAEPASPFLARLIDELGTAAREIVVDSSAFYDGPQKLGLGSSAAVTVAAARLALGEVDLESLFALVARVHDRAQGVRGSGADLAAAIHGGVIGFTPGNPLTHSSPAIARLAWPSAIRLVPFFTGVSADTAQLVSRVAAARAGSPVAVNAALTEIAAASLDVRDALASAGEPVISAFGRASRAVDQLAVATGLDLVPSCVRAAREAMSQLGGTAKTTGAGGGDVAIAVIPRSADVTTATRLLIEQGCRPLSLSIDPTGVDRPPPAQ
jgi:phosphomevalonate kinase